MPQTLLFWRRGRWKWEAHGLVTYSNLKVVSHTFPVPWLEASAATWCWSSRVLGSILLDHCSAMWVILSHKKEAVYGTESFSQTVSCLQRFRDPNPFLYFMFSLSYSIHTDTLTLKMLWDFCLAIYNWLFQIEIKLTNFFTISPFLPWFLYEASMRKYSQDSWGPIVYQWRRGGWSFRDALKIFRSLVSLFESIYLMVQW